ncbi:MAG: threo-3-hydroxy-L-aspartate ammonia-lyase [Marinicellaceae bacterium]
MIEIIKQAENRLAGHANKTPVLTSRVLNQKLGAEVFFKCENFQRVGAFKFRGAFNCISQLTPSQKKRGIIAYSSGNHAQAVALVGKMLKIKTTIVMPINAPQVKLLATKGYGAEVVLFDPKTQVREEISSKIQAQNGYSLIPPFDNKHVIAGQATAALELCNEISHLDKILVPCGGGGLLSGSAVASKYLQPACQVIGVEPEQADDAYQSYYSGVLVSQPNPNTIADGTRTSSLGHITFPLIKENVDAMVTVTETAIMHAVQYHFLRMKLVVEPSGALGLAALLSHKIQTSGRIGIIISGGNIDPKSMSNILSEQ